MFFLDSFRRGLFLVTIYNIQLQTNMPIYRTHKKICSNALRTHNNTHTRGGSGQGHHNGNHFTQHRHTGEFGFHDQIQTWARSAGVPDALLDNGTDAGSIHIGDLRTKPTTSALKIDHLEKVFTYLGNLQTAPSMKPLWNEHLTKEFAEYKIRLKEAFMPPRLSDPSISTFNQSGAKSFLNLVMDGGDTTPSNVSTRCKQFVEEHNLAHNAYNTYTQKITGPITNQSVHTFLREWKKIGNIFKKTKADKVRDEYYFLRWQAVNAFVDAEFKNATELTLPHTPEEYTAVKRSDQRQLLMLLCGDVPAELFVDAKTGHIRSEQQISHHILFLTKPYQMSNTRVGIVMQNVNWFVNTVKNGTVSFGKAVGWFIATIIEALSLAMLVYQFHKHDRLHRFAQNTAHMMLHLAVTLFQVFMRMSGMSKKKSRAFKYLRNVSELGRVLATTTAGALLWHVLSTQVIELSHNQQVPIIFATYRKAIDKWNLTRAMAWLAQLQPGMFGESTVSGISDDQLGLMHKVQDNLVELDIEILKTNQANMEVFRKRYVDIEQSYDRQKLWAELNVAYHAAQSSYVNPRRLRALLMKQYPHEFRAHHFFDSYGFPRSAIHIVLAYFCQWDREEREMQMPTVPYNDNTVHEYLHPTEYNALKKGRTLQGSLVHLNPIQSSEFYRKSTLFNPDKVVHDTHFVDDADLHEVDTVERGEHEVGNRNIRARIDLTDIFTHEKGFVGWIESTLPNNEEAIEQFRKISGWTHKISPVIQKRLIHEFDLNTRRSAGDYKQFVERQLRYQDKTADYQPTGTNAFYLVNDSYDYNIFHQDNKDYMQGTAYNALRDTSFRTFFEAQAKAKAAAPAAAAAAAAAPAPAPAPAEAAEHEYYEQILTTLREYEPIRAIYASMRMNESGTKQNYINTIKTRIQNGLMEVLGLYIQTYQSAEVEHVLRYRNADQRNRTQRLLERQYKPDAKLFLDKFVTDSNFQKLLKKWDRDKSYRKGKGGGQFHPKYTMKNT